MLYGMYPQTGEWINALVAEEPEYNEDFTKMTIKIREGIYWSDGIPFTADDVVFTVKKTRVIREWALNLSFKSM